MAIRNFYCDIDKGSVITAIFTNFTDIHPREVSSFIDRILIGSGGIIFFRIALL